MLDTEQETVYVNKNQCPKVIGYLNEIASIHTATVTLKGTGIVKIHP